MAELLPATIAKCFLLANFSYQEVPNTIRSQVDVGEAKARRRATRSYVSVNGSIIVDGTQLQALLQFYDVNLQSGVLRFEFADPVSGVNKDYRFINPPVITPVTDTHWSASLELEMFK